MNPVLRASALGAAALLSSFLFLPACHPIGACENCNPSTEYCQQDCNQQGLGPASCAPLPSDCLPNPTCACLGKVYVIDTCSGMPMPACVMFNTWSCSGDAKNGFFFETQSFDVSHC